MSRYLGGGLHNFRIGKNLLNLLVGGVFMNSSPHITQTSWPCQNQQGATATLHCLSIKIMANLPKCTLIYIYITYHITILQVCNYSRPKFFALSNIHFPVKPVLPPLVGFRSWAPELSSLGPSISRTLRDPRTSGVAGPLEAAVGNRFFAIF